MDDWKSTPGECVCGEPALPDSDWCEGCTAYFAGVSARQEAAERRQATREANARRLAELPPCDCAEPTLRGCALHSGAIDWEALPKTRRHTLYRETSARCVRYRAMAAERQQQQAEQQRQRDEERRRERQALEQHWVDLRAITLIEPIPSLAAMREVVLAERHDRCPKWRFKLAPDLVAQIQPRPAERRDKLFLFECTALRGDGIVREHFTSARARQGIGLQAVTFGILLEDGRWRLAVTGYTGLADSGAELYARRLELVALVVERLPRLAALNADQMFEPACLCCGKALTDPASMARFIGPECAGTSSLDAGLLALRAA